MSKQEKVTPISYDCKRLLLEVLTHGYITDEQKNSLSAFFDVEKCRVWFVNSREQLDEIRKIQKEMEERSTERLPPDYVETNSCTLSEIEQAFKEKDYERMADKNKTN